MSGTDITPLAVCDDILCKESLLYQLELRIVYHLELIVSPQIISIFVAHNCVSIAVTMN